MIERALAALEAAGDREVWTGLDASGEVEQRLGARALAGRVGAWQDHLDRNGVRPGQRVAIDLPRSPDLLAAHLAVLASGACAVPLNPALRPAERERVLARAEPSCLLDSAGSAGRPTPARLGPVAAERPALLIFTSGTTGEPKGVPLSLANMEANFAVINHWLTPEQGENWVALGLQFTSFDILTTFALLTVKFGTDFEIALIGIATLQDPPLVPPQEAFVRIGLDIVVSYKPEEGILQVTGQLTNDSFVYSYLCKLHGGFAFYSWFKDQGVGKAPAGDYVLSIGGYSRCRLAMSFQSRRKPAEGGSNETGSAATGVQTSQSARRWST